MKPLIRTQEGLKAIACGLMLIDHIGAILLPQAMLLRIIGRVSFPLFCFLLTEGVLHTRNPRQYLLRLLLAAVISDIPFDLAFYGRVGFAGQNVMWTLLLGCAMLITMEKTEKGLHPVLLILFAIGAWLLRTDYGGYGILTIALLAMTRKRKGMWLIRGMGLVLIGAVMGSPVLRLWGIPIPIQCFSALALIPMALYRGGKRGFSRWVQWGFYLFYPAHLLALCFLSQGELGHCFLNMDLLYW